MHWGCFFGDIKNTTRSKKHDPFQNGGLKCFILFPTIPSFHTIKMQRIHQCFQHMGLYLVKTPLIQNKHLMVDQSLETLCILLSTSPNLLGHRCWFVTSILTLCVRSAVGDPSLDEQQYNARIWFLRMFFQNKWQVFKISPINLGWILGLT